VARAVDDPQPEIRFRAAQVLARLADPAAVDALCGRFSLIVGGSWPSADEVAVLASALSRFRDDPRPAELIRPALLEMWVYVPRTEEDAVRAVLRTAEADASEYVRRYVNDALKMLDDPDLRH
jgi:hypothetical protein